MDGALKARLIQAGEIIADSARRLSSWSERIPASIHTITSEGSDTVLIVAGGEMAPHAITFEAPHAPWWKHPVFGRGPRETWHWVAQIPPRRFLLPAAQEHSEGAAYVISKVIDDWAWDLGFRDE